MLVFPRDRTIFLSIVVGLVAVGPTVADLVTFRRGGQVHLDATIEGDRVRLETLEGPKCFPRRDFETIVTGHRLMDDWEKRQDRALSEGGVETRFTAASWALERGLTDEAIAMIDGLRLARPGPGPIARTISALDRLGRVADDPELNDLMARLRPHRFREVRGPHVVFLHQLTDSEAIERLDVIERVTQTFLISFAAQAVDLPAPRRRLVSVCFADRRDYLAFLRRNEAEAFADTQGFYHPTLNLVVTYDTRSGEDQRAGHRAAINRKLAGDPTSEIDRRLLLLDLEWRETDLGILAHETVHQLVVATGLAPRSFDFPSWLQEGLAAQFEVVRGGRWAGVGRVNSRRLLDFRSIKPAPRLVPLLHDVGLGRGYQRDRYAEAWALVHFLQNCHPHEFVTFLDLLRNPTNDATTRPDRAFQAFRSAFRHDLSQIEDEWHEYVASLKTPSENPEGEDR